MKRDFLEKVRKVKEVEVQLLEKKQNRFLKLFRESTGLVFIAEIKPKSPSFSHAVNQDFLGQVKKYEENGIAGVSVLTDKSFFGGSFELMEKIARYTELPILCKDFILDKSQVVAAAKSGADAILLIVSFLSFEKLEELYEFADKLKLQPVLEIQNEDELELAMKLQPEVIAVNSRNLRTLEINKEKAVELIKKVPKNVISILFSGIEERKDIVEVLGTGARGVLVGSVLMNSSDVTQKIKELIGEI